jgi:Transglutaminase-like superfamily
MARYALASHVFVCRDEESIVVLDLKRDRYFTLEAVKTAPLRSALAGWPATPLAEAPVDSAIVAAAAPLLRQGWLLEESADSREATPVQPPGPREDLEDPGVGEKLNLGTMWAFVAASVFAKFALRFWRFERVVQRVAQRRARHATTAFDIERARRLLDTFARMRVFLFSTRDECLHDSLAVLEFLARHGLFPSWVFGVRARPFAAHCWVQSDGVVLNDSVEHVKTYVPIMVV